MGGWSRLGLGGEISLLREMQENTWKNGKGNGGYGVDCGEAGTDCDGTVFGTTEDVQQ